jgi:hypothetical protein
MKSRKASTTRASKLPVQRSGSAPGWVIGAGADAWLLAYWHKPKASAAASGAPDNSAFCTAGNGQQTHDD